MFRMCFKLIIDEVKNTIIRNNMLSYGEKVLIGVSGGPDSMCLLHLLYKFKDEYGLKLAVAHVNHCLRGIESDEDEKFVRNFCKSIDVDFYSTRVDINSLAKEKGISCESAGREARYEFFSHVFSQIDADKIALAHNANDQAETVMMRIMRGTGLEGLTGIKPVRDGIYIRPLINISRDEIENYCSEEKILTRTDRTNSDHIYTRNRIRLDLFPYINSVFDCNIIKSLNRLADTLRIDNDYIEKICDEKYRKYCVRDDCKIIISKEAFSEHEAILSGILRKAAKELTGTLNNFEKKHIYDIIDIQKHDTGKVVVLPKKIAALNNYGNIELWNYDKLTEDRLKASEKCILHEGINVLKGYSCKVCIRDIDNKCKIDFKISRNIKYFDLSKIKGDITIRYRKEGDKFHPLGLNGYKKLKNLLIDLKIPKYQRNSIPLICFGNEIAWIIGYNISDEFKIDSTTKKILEIKVESEE